MEKIESIKGLILKAYAMYMDGINQPYYKGIEAFKFVVEEAIKDASK